MYPALLRPRPLRPTRIGANDVAALCCKLLCLAVLASLYKLFCCFLCFDCLDKSGVGREDLRCYLAPRLLTIYEAEFYTNLANDLVGFAVNA